MTFGDSELILNPDGSIYHLNLLPEDIAPTIITVGDPDRVHQVSKYFDSIEFKKGKREFVTHTGTLQGHRITIISTGIGTDNIDIVLNELDALANIDFFTKKIREKPVKLNFIRIGTSGAIQPEIPVDSFILTQTAIGFDGLLHFYGARHARNMEMEQDLVQFLGWDAHYIHPYVTDCDPYLGEKLASNQTKQGITVTNAGFYGPQGRQLRLKPRITDFFEKLTSYSYNQQKITNLEMETAGIYGLANSLGHNAVSLNAILANRTTGTFSKNPSKTIDNLIRYTLEKLSK